MITSKPHTEKIYMHRFNRAKENIQDSQLSAN
jgi:hypothetical protein